MKTVENANVNTKFRGNIVLLQENAIFFAKNLSNFKSFQKCLPNLYIYIYIYISIFFSFSFLHNAHLGALYQS